MTPEELSKLNVVQLKQECANMGLDQTGRKADLIKKLRDAIKLANGDTSESFNETEEVEDDQEGEEEDTENKGEAEWTETNDGGGEEVVQPYENVAEDDNPVEEIADHVETDDLIDFSTDDATLEADHNAEELPLESSETVSLKTEPMTPQAQSKILAGTKSLQITVKQNIKSSPALPKTSQKNAGVNANQGKSKQASVPVAGRDQVRRAWNSTARKLRIVVGPIDVDVVFSESFKEWLPYCSRVQSTAATEGADWKCYYDLRLKSLLHKDQVVNGIKDAFPEAQVISDENVFRGQQVNMVELLGLDLTYEAGHNSPIACVNNVPSAHLNEEALAKLFPTDVRQFILDVDENDKPTGRVFILYFSTDAMNEQIGLSKTSPVEVDGTKLVLHAIPVTEPRTRKNKRSVNSEIKRAEQRGKHVAKPPNSGAHVKGKISSELHKLYSQIGQHAPKMTSSERQKAIQKIRSMERRDGVPKKERLWGNKDVRSQPQGVYLTSRNTSRPIRDVPPLHGGAGILGPQPFVAPVPVHRNANEGGGVRSKRSRKNKRVGKKQNPQQRQHNFGAVAPPSFGIQMHPQSLMSLNPHLTSPMMGQHQFQGQQRFDSGRNFVRDMPAPSYSRVEEPAAQNTGALSILLGLTKALDQLNKGRQEPAAPEVYSGSSSYRPDVVNANYGQGDSRKRSGDYIPGPSNKRQGGYGSDTRRYNSYN